MYPAARSHNRATLTVSAVEVTPGQIVTLQWHVVGVAANVASVHLSSAGDDGTTAVESVPARGLRECIFARPGTYRFLLLATFGDGARRSVEVSVSVTV
jgi:hypothetical protein